MSRIPAGWKRYTVTYLREETRFIDAADIEAAAAFAKLEASKHHAVAVLSVYAGEHVARPAVSTV